MVECNKLCLHLHPSQDFVQDQDFPVCGPTCFCLMPEEMALTLLYKRRYRKVASTSSFPDNGLY